MQFKNFLLAMTFIVTLGATASKSAYAAKDNYVELEYSHATLTNGYNAWNDVNVLDYFGIGEHRFVFELDHKSHFGQNAGVLGVTYTHIWDADWYQDFSTSFSTNSAIVPSWTVFTELHRKLLPSQALVAGLGVGHNISQEPYNDTYGLAELDYYFTEIFSIQGGTRVNESSPGSVVTWRGFASVNFLYALWEGYVRYEAGREGYSVIGANTFRNEFSSHDEAISVRRWFSSGIGVGVRFDSYQSDYYNRNEVALDLLMRY